MPSLLSSPRWRCASQESHARRCSATPGQPGTDCTAPHRTAPHRNAPPPPTATHRNAPQRSLRPGRRRRRECVPAGLWVGGCVYHGRCPTAALLPPQRCVAASPLLLLLEAPAATATPSLRRQARASCAFFVCPHRASRCIAVHRACLALTSGPSGGRFGREATTAHFPLPPSACPDAPALPLQTRRRQTAHHLLSVASVALSTVDRQ